ncbi:MAG TPA: UvrD-helicase domain-containing protein [Anaeromyxobacteraceae bacterium]|nr:UvrD-helicase domain-containing protein [Anaeromyxobacteraceae bacterium]
MSGIVFSEAAQALFRLEAPTALSAGAGSGKTTALVELCVRLLSGEALGTPCEPAEIAAITFTEKAAEELDERLRAAVAARTRAARGTPEADAWLSRLHGLDRLAVGTIHAFAGRLLREHALEAGLDPEFAVADEETAGGWLRAAARSEVLAALDAGDAAARALCAAFGAGGARTGLADLLVELARARATRGDRGVPVPAPDDPAAADAARDAVLAAAADVLAARGEAKSVAARAAVEALRRAVDALRDEDRRGPLRPDGLARLLALGAAVKGGRWAAGDGALKGFRDDLLARAEALAPLGAEVLARDGKAALCALLEGAERRYLARKRAERAVDFDDLLVLARDLVAGRAAVRDELRARFRALLVDEYQDVNPVQQELVELLWAVPGAGEAGGPIPVAVGDLKQSIYRFRGADVAVFARVIRRFGDAGAGRVLHLSVNHRSAPAILDFVNAVSERALQPPAGVPPRDDELRFGEHDRLVATRAGGASPACELLDDAEGGPAAERRTREARAIAARIAAIVSGAAGIAARDRSTDSGGTGVEGGERPRRPRYADVAILFRRLTQIGPYERALREAGIPYRLARGGGFFQAPEIRDLGELLASLFDPEDAGAWAALLRSPLCAISDGALLALAPELGRLWRLPAAALAAAGIAPEEHGRLARFLEVWRELREVRDRLAPPDLLARAIAALDLDAAHLAAPDGERRAVNLEKALAVARRFAEGGGTAAELGAHLRLLATRPPREPEADLDAGDAVAVLSVHQAKGLEWPVVFVPDLGADARVDARRAVVDAEGRVCLAAFDLGRETFLETASLAAARAREKRAADAESRRLLYVALTRARDQLVLSGEPSRGRTGGWRGHVEEAAAARPELVRRVPIAEAGTFAAGPPVSVNEPEPAPEARREPLHGITVNLALPAPVPAIRMAVTELAEYARCPRRHRFTRVLGLAEPAAFGAAAPGDDPGRATARGTLAHAMLAESDLAAPPLERRAQLAAAAARRGYDPDRPGVRRILAEVSRFLASAGGRLLADAAREGRLRREVPFTLRVDGAGGAPACYLVGALDALVDERRGGGRLVVDFKYAVPRAGAAERYRLQLLAYALATGRASPGARLRTRLQFLRGDHRAVDAAPDAGALAAFAAEAPALAWGAFRGDGEQPPGALGRDAARCRAEGCGFVSRCFPDAARTADAA